MLDSVAPRRTVLHVIMWRDLLHPCRQFPQVKLEMVRHSRLLLAPRRVRASGCTRLVTLPPRAQVRAAKAAGRCNMLCGVAAGCPWLQQVATRSAHR